MDVLKVRAFWDGRAEVWGAVSNDIPGLITEADTLDELAAMVKSLALNMLAAQGRADAAQWTIYLETDITTRAVVNRPLEPVQTSLLS